LRHKATTLLAKSHGELVIEDLRVRNMTASARGTVHETGTNVAQKAGLNRSLLNERFGEFRRMLEYKCGW
jgi:putative transposase